MATKRKDLSDTAPSESADNPLFISNYGLALTVYILYLIGFITGISSIIGVIIASLQVIEVIRYCGRTVNFRSGHFRLGSCMLL